MKNISRRVFIKGLAVAGVAAAASTVLAGCNTNMIPGVDDGKDDEVTEPVATNKYTFTTVDGKTLVISAPSAVTSTVGTTTGPNVFLSVHVENKLGGSVKFVDALTTAQTVAATADDYVVVLSCQVSDKDNNNITTGASVATNAASFAVTNLLSSTLADGFSGTYAFGWKNQAGMKDWAKIVLTAKVYEKIETAETGKYVYGKTEVGKHDFTYTR